MKIFKQRVFKFVPIGLPGSGKTALMSALWLGQSEETLQEAYKKHPDVDSYFRSKQDMLTQTGELQNTWEGEFPSTKGTYVPFRVKAEHHSILFQTRSDYMGEFFKKYLLYLRSPDYTVTNNGAEHDDIWDRLCDSDGVLLLVDANDYLARLEKSCDHVEILKDLGFVAFISELHAHRPDTSKGGFPLCMCFTKCGSIDKQQILKVINDLDRLDWKMITGGRKPCFDAIELVDKNQFATEEAKQPLNRLYHVWRRYRGRAITGYIAGAAGILLLAAATYLFYQRSVETRNKTILRDEYIQRFQDIGTGNLNLTKERSEFSDIPEADKAKAPGVTAWRYVSEDLKKYSEKRKTHDNLHREFDLFFQHYLSMQALHNASNLTFNLTQGKWDPEATHEYLREAETALEQLEQPLVVRRIRDLRLERLNRHFSRHQQLASRQKEVLASEYNSYRFPIPDELGDSHRSDFTKQLGRWIRAVNHDQIVREVNDLLGKQVVTGAFRSELEELRDYVHLLKRTDRITVGFEKLLFNRKEKEGFETQVVKIVITEHQPGIIRQPHQFIPRQQVTRNGIINVSEEGRVELNWSINTQYSIALHNNIRKYNHILDGPMLWDSVNRDGGNYLGGRSFMFFENLGEQSFNRWWFPGGTYTFNYTLSARIISPEGLTKTPKLWAEAIK